MFYNPFAMTIFNAKIIDRTTFNLPKESKRTITDEGFLRVPGRVARTGIQEYLAGELGLDGDPSRIIRVMRPPEEVFHPDSLESYTSADVTIEHPNQMVDSKTYKQVSVGTVRGGGTQDGGFVLADLMIKDERGIDAVNTGKVQLSAGYTANYDDDVPDGADYEFIQRNIRINHVALVDRARAGAQARLFDHQTKVITMTKVTLDSGREIEIEDKAMAALIEDSQAALRKRVKDAEEKADKAEAEKDEMTEEMREEKKKSSDAAISARVEAVLKVKDQALKIAGKDFTCDSLDPLAIQRSALSKKNPNRDWADKSDTYVTAAWDMALDAAEEEKENEDEGEDKEDKKDSSDSQYRNLAKDAANAIKGKIESPALKYKAAFDGAWKKTVGQED